jgi:hypothetical protein
LFIRAFLLTDRKLENINEFPFYGNWKTEEHSGYYFMAHQLAGMHVYESGNNSFFIFGHAYNPFTMEIDETVILERIASAYGTEDYIDRINELTGVFVYGSIVAGAVEFFVDPSGMQSAFYGKVENSFYLTSHAQLIGDLCNLEMDGFVKELLAYKWYGRVMGPYLPADLSPFGSVKRIVPSIQYWYKNGEITHKRFWYLTENQIAYDEQNITRLLSRRRYSAHNMVLISKKWNRPWISLTGGIDSNTTLPPQTEFMINLKPLAIFRQRRKFPMLPQQKKYQSISALSVTNSKFRKIIPI